VAEPANKSKANNPTGKGGFAKGQSGNPSGRPKNQLAVAPRIRHYLSLLELPAESACAELPLVDQFSIRAIRSAIFGKDRDALRWWEAVINRCDGKVPDRLEVRDVEIDVDGEPVWIP